MGYLPRRTAHRERNKPKAEFVALNKAGGGRAINPLTLDMELQDLAFALVDFGLAFGPVFPYYAPVPFGIVMYSMCHFLLEGCDFLLFILQGLQLRACLESPIRLWTFNF